MTFFNVLGTVPGNRQRASHGCVESRNVSANSWKSLKPDRHGFVRCMSTSGFHRVAYTDWGPVRAENLSSGVAVVKSA
jgi:hypothetical protein